MIGNALYMSIMTLIVLHLCVLICIFKRTRGRRKDKENTKSHFHVHKYYLWIGDEGFLFGENNFDLLWIKENVWFNEEPFVSDLRSFPFMCFETGCCCWHKYKCVLFLCILKTIQIMISLGFLNVIIDHS